MLLQLLKSIYYGPKFYKMGQIFPFSLQDIDVILPTISSYNLQPGTYTLEGV